MTVAKSAKNERSVESRKNERSVESRKNEKIERTGSTANTRTWGSGSELIPELSASQGEPGRWPTRYVGVRSSKYPPTRPNNMSADHAAIDAGR